MKTKAPPMILKTAAHLAMDRIWRSGAAPREKVRVWLSNQLRIPPDRCHMGQLTEDELRRVVEVCQRSNWPSSWKPKKRVLRKFAR